ncbi:MAG: hypothetical protein LQ351_004698 [Letrouitia transgressa]|nr:MAG: hypothetical protein LQ351_004698 [Letrouitia transgressa]
MDSLILAHGAKSPLSAQGLTFSVHGLRIMASPVPRAQRVFTYGVFRDVLSGLAEMMRVWGYREIRAEVGIVQLVYMRPDGWVKFTQETPSEEGSAEALAGGVGGGVEEVAAA